MRDLAGILRPGDLLVFNDTRVIPARLFAVKSTGGRVELLVERITGARTALVHARSSKPLRSGQRLEIAGGGEVRVGERCGALIAMESPNESVLGLLQRAGHVPLPPYIRRSDEPTDRERYQSVFARMPGAVAAPTASLHFDEPLLEALEQHGVGMARITLHVGSGTFQPVRVENPRAHRLHQEWCEVPEATVSAIKETRERGGRVIAVGTTVVRSLEGAAAAGELQPYTGEIGLFILPGFRFRVIDAMITNFHLPRSTLLMLVCAAAGRERVLEAYRHAVASRYRFYSYGDAMYVSLDPVVQCASR